MSPSEKQKEDFRGPAVRQYGDLPQMPEYSNRARRAKRRQTLYGQNKWQL
jgi:hypothetical protein